MSKNNGNLANEGKVHKKKRKQVNVYDMLFNSRRKRIYIDEVMCIASVYVFVFSVFFQIDQGREK